MGHIYEPSTIIPVLGHPKWLEGGREEISMLEKHSS